jgi:hypothetical protein
LIRQCGLGFADGLFMQVTTGNVWTRVPVVRTYAYGRIELAFYLRYDSIRAEQDGVVGYGWTHSYNRWIEEPSSNYAIYHDGEG